MKSIVLGLIFSLLGVVASLVDQQYPNQLPIGFNIDDNINGKKHNVIFILVDDQDLQMDSLSYTPIARRELMEKGTFYKNHFVTTALCCPSRVSLWTGLQAHNTNVTDIFEPYGGYPKFVAEGFNENWLPVWLQEAGYNTYYTGKLFNAHTVANYHSPYVKGFNQSDFVLDPYTYNYMNSSWQRNHDPVVSYEGLHTTDVISVKAYDMLSDALADKKPFFMGIAPIAPHSNGVIAEGNSNLTFDDIVESGPPIPLPRHADLFPDAKVPRTPHFNPDKPSGVNWISELQQHNQTVIDYNDNFYRRRLQALQGPEEIIAGVIRILEAHDQLDNTYIIYTSDNGYHIGQHRLHPGKECGFEEDIRVPLFIRGPGVPVNQIVDTVTTHIDLAPTIFDMLDIPLRPSFDGTPVPIRSDIDDNFLRHEHVAVEYWGWAASEGIDDKALHKNNTYKSLRIIGEGYDFYYSVWCNNKHQLYDLIVDPYELDNIYPEDLTSGPETLLMGYPLSRVIDRLDALTFVLKSCKGESCIKPWDVLHPEADGKIASLKDALDSGFDAFYEAQYKVEFDRCEMGYIIDAEGPQIPLTYRYGGSWSEWV